MPTTRRNFAVGRDATTRGPSGPVTFLRRLTAPPTYLLWPVRQQHVMALELEIVRLAIEAQHALIYDPSIIWAMLVLRDFVEARSAGVIGAWREMWEELRRSCVSWAPVQSEVD
ncbi:uncharacterized protein J7T54_001092 [Emericellopsis cladophorae]|uniref:Uncharacterized protein n=1 Tax=Emericellopsis cladophorae TaxID=2686198 RepID=A0A9Q0BE25_9HYPO|nr:uncharacterized protein J7T54_001092 [Emericellopsis cladophorae]KAI6780784.1 hypothetical protein J7T54_001092 [Emericellopsis cladophorae]